MISLLKMFDDLVASGVPEAEARISANAFASMQESNDGRFEKMQKESRSCVDRIENSINGLIIEVREFNAEIKQDMKWLTRILSLDGGLLFSAIIFLFGVHSSRAKLR